MGISLGVTAVIDRPDADAPRVGNASKLARLRQGCQAGRVERAMRWGRRATRDTRVRSWNEGFVVNGTLDADCIGDRSLGGMRGYICAWYVGESRTGVKVRDTVCLWGERAGKEN